MSRPSLLIAEPPLQVLPSLAKVIGLNEAIVLQQIQYWAAQEQGVVRDGRRWIYNSVEEWRKQFPFWSTDTIQRTLQSLRDKNLVDAQKLSPDKWKHTLYYSVNYNNLQDCITAECGKGLRENAESITADCNDGITAECDIPLPQVAVIIHTENTQRLPETSSSEAKAFSFNDTLPYRVQEVLDHQCPPWYEEHLRLALVGRSPGGLASYALEILRGWKRGGKNAPQAPLPEVPVHVSPEPAPALPSAAKIREWKIRENERIAAELGAETPVLSGRSTHATK
jgi:hypothetical protein